MARPPTPLTPELQGRIVAFVRAGGYPHVAAEAAGVPRHVFERWLKRGGRRKARAWREGRAGPTNSKPAVSRVVAWRRCRSRRRASDGGRCMRHSGERSRARIIAGCVVVLVAR